MSLPEARLHVITDELAKHDRVVVKDLAERFQVSRETIRRDLKGLELDGKLRCTYGGAVRAQSEGDRPFSLRLKAYAREKAKVGERAAKLVRDDTSIFVDAGTTTLAFARHLVNRDRVRVFTNSLDIAQLLAGGSVAELYLMGGRLRPDYRAMLGHLTVEAVQQHVFDAAFLGIATLDLKHGFMDFGQEEASLRRVLAQHAKQVVMLADSSKFGSTASVRTLDLRQVHHLVTDRTVEAAYAARLRDAGVEIIDA
jgi:DeoR family transcriptional regulator, glycerol-3-phosphate regulon repressor